VIVKEGVRRSKRKYLIFTHVKEININLVQTHSSKGIKAALVQEFATSRKISSRFD